MNSFPEDDDALTMFLRQHRPIPPLAPSSLEDRILAGIESTPQLDGSDRMPLSVPFQRRNGWSKGMRQRFWWMSSAIAAGMVVAIAGHHTLAPPPPNEVETAELESFIEHTWTSGTAEASDLSPSDTRFEEEELFASPENPAIN